MLVEEVGDLFVTPFVFFPVVLYVKLSPHTHPTMVHGGISLHDPRLAFLTPFEYLLVLRHDVSWLILGCEDDVWDGQRFCIGSGQCATVMKASVSDRNTAMAS